MRSALKLTLLCICLVSFQAIAGAILKTETREYHVDPPAIGTTTMYADGVLLRIEINSVSSAEDGLVIYRGDRNELLVADSERLEYYVIDEQSMNQMAAQVGDAKKQMDEMMKTLPPDQRAMAEQMMKRQMPALQSAPEVPSTVQKTGKSDTVNGFDCEYYEVLKEGRKSREMCVAKWSDIDGGAEAVDAMMGMGKFFERMHDAFASAAGTDFMGKQQEVFAHMRKLGGYPVYARDYDETGALEGESSLKSSESEAIDTAMFAAPEGYRKQDMMQ
jgi:Domain of unknown function (DUF4412)